MYSLASPTVYAESEMPDQYFSIFRNSQELEDLLNTCSSNISSIHENTQKAWKWVRNNRLQKHQAQERLDWYLRLWENRDVLNESLRARLDQLKRLQ